MKFWKIVFFVSTFLPAVLSTIASAQVAFDKPDFDVRSGPTLALDFNRDGITDLAVAVDGSMFVNLNPGDGTVSPGTEFPAGRQPLAMIAGGFNGDDIVDLAELGADGTVTVLLGNGDGTFSGPMSTATGATRIIGSITAADLNGDGLTDVAFTTSDSNIFVLLGNCDGSFNGGSFCKRGWSVKRRS